jgi:hypothetical protein
LKRRRQGQSAEVIALADKAMYRLYRRFHRMLAKGKPAGKTVVAIARELAGFVWAALHSRCWGAQYSVIRHGVLLSLRPR